MQTLTFDIKQDGSTEGLYYDNFPLNFLGKVKMERVSEIYFNTVLQKWCVLFYDTTLDNDSVFDSYESARDYEVTTLELQRQYNVL
jgi:hypothetical protein